MSDSHTNPWFGISMALIGVIAGYGIALSSGSVGSPSPTAQVANAPSPAAAPTPTPEPQTADNVKPVDTERDHIRGNRNAKIAVIEYADYECPFCARNHPTMEQLVTNNDDVMWIYRHFPLAFHPSATPTAEASECVWEQGGDDAFWKFNDTVFTSGANVAKNEEYATQSGVDAAKFTECMSSGKYTQYVQDEMAAGSAAGISGTPGVIVLNIKTGKTQIVSGAQPIASFQAAIDALK